MDKKVIGHKIRELRSRMGLTTVSLAKRVGISQAQVSRLENGLQGFRHATLVKFSKVLNVPPVYFFVEGTDAPTSQLAKELKARRMEASPALRKALANAAFLRFMERCAKAFKRGKGKLEVLKAAVKRAAR